MTCEEHYFENLLFYGEDCKTNCNKNALSPEVQEAIEMCAYYVLYTIFMTRENFLAYVREDNARTKGEWIAREDMDYIDENKVVHNHFECNKCGFIHDFIDGHTAQYNFCPNCGADVRVKDELNRVKNELKETENDK